MAYDREVHIRRYKNHPDLRPPQWPPDEWDLASLDLGYTWCRPHKEWHRPPECAVDETGQPLMPDGQPWDDNDQADQHDGRSET